VRVLAATNKDLEQAVLDGRFRDDLFYRLNVIQIAVPPLRERLEEIPLLVDHFIRRYAKLFNRSELVPSPSAMERLMRHRYPGNVRELENIIKRMIVLSDPHLVRIPLSRPRGETTETAAQAPPADVPSPGLKDIARDAAQAAERQAIARVLEETGWNRTRAAKVLKISYRALLYKIKEARIERTLSGQPLVHG
jgi:two-component system, NtrC family, response regulator AtoC